MKRKSGKGRGAGGRGGGGGGGGGARGGELQYFGANLAPSQNNSTLQRLADGLKQQLESSHGFWIRLPYQLCADQRLASGGADLSGGSGENSCWNGLSNGRWEFFFFNLKKFLNKILSSKVEF